MFPNHISKKKSDIIKKTAALVAVIVASAFMLWLLGRDSAVNVQTTTAMQADEKPMSENEFMKGLEDAAGAAFAASPVTGTVTERPDFVSELEWQVLRNAVTRHYGTNNTDLTRLVNKLLFAKKWEAWLSHPGDTARRKTLARQLLAMIPAQIASRSLDPAEARKMEIELNAELRKSGL